MTSSLVGSEMCIRDRHWKMSTPEHLGPQDHEEKLKFIGVMMTRARKDAVSYTHLTLPTICSV
eukprot:2760104-Prorocentrum_lima.AAC.1